MGTNFYWHFNHCGTCDRYDIAHVGKRSAGWSFGFRGYRHDPNEGIYSPFHRPVLSRVDWRDIFGRGGTLVDEYGVEVERPMEFLDDRVPPTPSEVAWEDSQEQRGRWARPLPNEREWRDPEGFRFYDGEFS